MISEMKDDVIFTRSVVSLSYDCWSSFRSVSGSSQHCVRNRNHIRGHSYSHKQKDARHGHLRPGKVRNQLVKYVKVTHDCVEIWAWRYYWSVAHDDHNQCQYDGYHSQDIGYHSHSPGNRRWNCSRRLPLPQVPRGKSRKKERIILVRR